MPPFVFYLLKVMLCSAVLDSYYRIVLANKKFHFYNRFYLIAAVVLSWTIPLVKIRFWDETNSQPQVIKLLTIVANGNRYVEETSTQNWFLQNWITILAMAFSFISAIILGRLLIIIFQIALLVKRSFKEKLNDVFLVFTNTKGTPFSFFKYIFLNDQIQFDTVEGNHILKHELVHFQEKHSVDKLFLNLILVAGWYNPFMWLIQKELNMIHEFIADEKAIENGDAADFAAMLLKTVFPQYTFPIVNSFFYSPIKRRILMLTSSKKTSYTYLRRVAVLPVLMLTSVLFAFGFKKEKTRFKVHKSVNAFSVNKDQIIATTDNNYQDTIKKKRQENFLKGSIEGTTKMTLKDSDGSVVTVEAAKTSIDTGDLKKGLVVVDGKEMTWSQFEKIPSSNIILMTVLKGESATSKYGEKGKDGVIEITTKQNQENQKFKEDQKKYAEEQQKYMREQKKDVEKQQKYMEDQKKHMEEQQKYMQEQKKYIENQQKYTIDQKNDLWEQKIQRVFTVVENPPYYPKGMSAFAEYVNSNMQYPKEAVQNKKEGAVLIQFIVDEEGKLTDFKKLSDKGYGLEEEAIRLLKNSGNWNPGIQNGHKVPVQIQQQIIFQLPKSL